MPLPQRASLTLLLLAASFAGAQAGAQTGPQPASLRPYTNCRFADGLTMSGHTPLAADVRGRTVLTIGGERQVAITRGEKLQFGYPGSNPVARVTVEQLPAASFEDGKANLIGGFEKILASDNAVARNYALKPKLNGFEINGLDRAKLEGNVLGIYMLIDDATHVVTSIDFLNYPGNFSSIADYTQFRDRFLAAYTTCLRSPATKPAQPGAAPAKKVPARKASATRKKS